MSLATRCEVREVCWAARGAAVEPFQCFTAVVMSTVLAGPEKPVTGGCERARYLFSILCVHFFVV